MEDFAAYVSVFGFLFFAVSATVRIYFLQRRLSQVEKLVSLHTETHKLAHGLAQMHEDDITKVFAHVGLSRANVPQIGPYR